MECFLIAATIVICDLLLIVLIIRSESLIAACLRLRFSLRSLVFLMLYAALICAWVKWFPVAPGNYYLYLPGFWGLLSIGALAWSAASFKLFPGCSPADIFLLGGLIALLHLMCGFIFSGFSSMSPPSDFRGIAREVTWNFQSVLVLRSALPLFVALPVAYWLFVNRPVLCTPATRYIALALGIATIDLVIGALGSVVAYRMAAGLPIGM